MDYKTVLRTPEQIKHEEKAKERVARSRRANEAARIKAEADDYDGENDEPWYPEETRVHIKRGHELRERRLALGWTGKELARRVGVSEGTISQVQAGGNPCSEVVYERILDVITDAEMDALITQESQTPPPVNYKGDEAFDRFQLLLAKLPDFCDDCPEAVQLRWFDTFDKIVMRVFDQKLVAPFP